MVRGEYSVHSIPPLLYSITLPFMAFGISNDGLRGGSITYSRCSSSVSTAVHLVAVLLKVHYFCSYIPLIPYSSLHTLSALTLCPEEALLQHDLLWFWTDIPQRQFHAVKILYPDLLFLFTLDNLPI